MQPLHTVVEMEQFSSSAKRANVTEDEIGKIISELAKNPTAGQVIAGTGGARKFRYRGRGKGKSGEYRVVTFFTGDDMPVGSGDYRGYIFLSEHDTGFFTTEITEGTEIFCVAGEVFKSTEFTTPCQSFSLISLPKVIESICQRANEII